MVNLTPLFQHVEENREKYLEYAKRLISVPSVSTYGSGLEECADLVAEMLENHGFRVEKFSNPEGGGPILLGTINYEAHATLMFYNHYDVQPAEPLEKWTTPPFTPVVRNGKLYGRGAADNKGNIAARLAAVDALLSTLGELPVNLKFLIEGGEEVGSPGLEKFVRENRDKLFADGCIWEYGYVSRSGSPVIYLGQKGMLYVEMEIQGPASDLHSSWGAVVENRAWRLVQALSTMRGPDGRVTVDGFYDDVVYEGEELLEKLDISEFSPPHKLLKSAEKNPLRQLFLEPTINLNGLYAGYIGPGSKTIIPAKASAKLDIRLVPRQTPEKIKQLLLQHLEKNGLTDIKLHIHQAYPAARTSPDNFLPKLVADTAATAYGKPSIIIPSGAASGPMYVITDILETPCVSTGCGYYGSSPHGPDENIRLTDFTANIKHIALIMLNFKNYLYTG
ncbi:peptidase M20 [Candidatus Caldarchaeum subterraneum]|uniref:Peptidase M20 n=1 Tax=Caldiarchaeum subterraneum TaxID=311458 RepID=E6N768_CALS0|nr:peptidase M20 [Candidatus Caldarchaeum subterraneum]BAJ50897.1 peptidase M20 [Candidatus Caldarchaeum subterraneum]GBC72548.1 Succinyl-diaminopimelate desuccinylase [archaeon HR03]